MWRCECLERGEWHEGVEGGDDDVICMSKMKNRWCVGEWRCGV